MDTKTLIYRKNLKFYINESKIKPQFRKVDVINALYGAIYEEFKGAIHNSKYVNMTPVEKIQQVNIFAEDWLKKRGFL